MAVMLAITSAMLPSNLYTVDFSIVNSDEAQLCLIAVFDLTLEFTCNSVAVNTYNLESTHRCTHDSTKGTTNVRNKLRISSVKGY